MNLQEELAKIYSSYTQEVRDELESIAKDTAKECAREVRTSANAAFPKGVNYSTGNYARAWTYGSRKVNKKLISQVVYAKAPYYRLTHLLENGHRIVNPSGKQVGYYEGKRHIQPIAEKYTRQFEERVERLFD